MAGNPDSGHGEQIKIRAGSKLIIVIFSSFENIQKTNIVAPSPS